MTTQAGLACRGGGVGAGQELRRTAAQSNEFRAPWPGPRRTRVVARPGRAGVEGLLRLFVAAAVVVLAGCGEGDPERLPASSFEESGVALIETGDPAGPSVAVDGAGVGAVLDRNDEAEILDDPGDVGSDGDVSGEASAAGGEDGGGNGVDAGGDDGVIGVGDGDVDGDGVVDYRLVVIDDGLGGVVVEGLCGLPGPLCRGDQSEDPLEEGGPLLKLHRSVGGQKPWVGRVLDMCDDREALVVVSPRNAGRDEPISARHMELILRKREFYPIVCSEEEAATPRWSCSTDDLPELEAFLRGFEEPPEPSVVLAWIDSQGLYCEDAAAERLRYVYVGVDGPMWPQASVEAAVEAYWAEHERWNGAWHLVERLGSWWSPELREPGDELLVVARSTVSVIDGAVRGLAQNYSERLWARDVVVTATDPHGARGQWHFALAVQPGESFPFEIEAWTGSDDPADISFEVSADLSPKIDLTRALIFDLEGRTNYTAEGFLFQPAEMTHGEIPEGDVDLWEVSIRRHPPWSHPRLAKDALEQTIENLIAYGVNGTEDGVVTDVFELTPMNLVLPQHEWVEVRTIGTVLPDGRGSDGARFTAIAGYEPSIWVGGAIQHTEQPSE